MRLCSGLSQCLMRKQLVPHCIWYIKRVWAQNQVPLGTVPRRLGFMPRGLWDVPRGLDQPSQIGHRSWHIAKSHLAQTKLWVNQNTPPPSTTSPYMVILFHSFDFSISLLTILFPLPCIFKCRNLTQRLLHMESIDFEIEATKENACALAKDLKKLNRKTHGQEMIQKAILKKKEATQMT